MPFRCRCGKTYEKPDTFASHTSACALFHQRRASDTNAILKQKQQSLPTLPTSINATSAILPMLIRQEQDNQSQQQQQPSPVSPEAMMQGAFLPTGLSLQYALEGAARKRSMSYDDNSKFSP